MYDWNQGCQIFLGTLNQNGKILTKLTKKYTKRPLNTPNGHKIPNVNKIYICNEIFHSKAFKSIPKLEFLVRKYTLWQP
jgi:hypothetical protein